MALENLRHLRDDFDDDIPDQKAFGGFKAQRKWWQNLIFGLEDALNEGIIPSELQERVNEFIRRYTSDKFHKQPLTAQEDVQEANFLIDKICGEKKKD